MTQRRTVLAALAAPALAQRAAAQPVAGGRSIRLVIPFPPGGAVDVSGRLIAERLGPALGQTVVVENRAGAGGLVGAEAVARGDRDGSTIGLVGVSILCAMQFMHARMPFDPAKDLALVGQITDGAMLCVVNADTARARGWTDFRALVRWSRAHPEEVRMGSSGNATTSHLNIAAINRFADAKILHVPYRGGAPAINDLLAGNIDMMFDVPPALMPHVTSGKFRALAVSSAEPQPFLPDVPGMRAFADLGLGDHALLTWNAIVAAGGTPEPVVQRLHAALTQAARDPDFAARLAPLGFTVALSDSPGALAQLIQAETPRWKRLVEISGARLD